MSSKLIACTIYFNEVCTYPIPGGFLSGGLTIYLQFLAYYFIYIGCTDSGGGVFLDSVCKNVDIWLNMLTDTHHDNLSLMYL